MENQKKKQKMLCIEFQDANGVLVPHLCKCPASPEMLMSALQFITDGCEIVISIKDEPFDYLSLSSDVANINSNIDNN